jgi:uncharacterized membrane protein YphA (DoxX/SURF4 family)
MAGTSGTTTACPSKASVAKRPRRQRLFKLLEPVCRYVLVAVFLMAGITKVTDLQGFADELRHSGLPYSARMVVAAVLPWLELTCAACLLAGYAVREAALLLAILSIALLVYSLLHVNEGDCNCFVFPTPKALSVWWWPPLRNLLFFLCAVRTAWR